MFFLSKGCYYQKPEWKDEKKVRIELPKTETLFDECEWMPFVDTRCFIFYIPLQFMAISVIEFQACPENSTTKVTLKSFIKTLKG